MKNLFPFVVILAVSLAFQSSALDDGDEEPPSLTCADLERSIEGTVITIRCHLEVANQGPKPLSDVTVTVVDSDGAVVNIERFEFSYVEPWEKSKSRDELVYSFDYAAREPPSIEWRLSYRDGSGEDREIPLKLWE